MCQVQRTPCARAITRDISGRGSELAGPPEMANGGRVLTSLRDISVRGGELAGSADGVLTSLVVSGIEEGAPSVVDTGATVWVGQSFRGRMGATGNVEGPGTGPPPSGRSLASCAKASTILLT